MNLELFIGIDQPSPIASPCTVVDILPASVAIDAEAVERNIEAIPAALSLPPIPIKQLLFKHFFGLDKDQISPGQNITCELTRSDLTYCIFSSS